MRDSFPEWELIFNVISDPVSIHDKDFRIIKANRAFAEVVGIPCEALIGKRCYEVIHGMDHPLPQCPHLQCLERGEPFTKEVIQ